VPWVEVYNLRNDSVHIAQVQKATLTTEESGLAPGHGLFGSPEWWKAIDEGEIPTITIHGHIARTYMGSMNDWPEVEVEANGNKTQWTRYGADSLYEVGRPIEIKYVLQKWRTKRLDRVLGEFSKVALTMRVSAPDTEDFEK